MKTTLSAELKKLLDAKGVSLAAAARACDFSNATVWKITNGKLVRWETLHTVMVVVLKIRPGNEKYELLKSLWISEREVNSSREEGHGKQNAPAHEQAAVRHFRRLIKGRSQKDVAMILGAAKGVANSGL